MTERVVDVAARSVSWRSTVDLIVSQRCQCFTLSHTESYIKVHQSIAALQISTLHVYEILANSIQLARSYQLLPVVIVPWVGTQGNGVLAPLIIGKQRSCASMFVTRNSAIVE